MRPSSSLASRCSYGCPHSSVECPSTWAVEADSAEVMIPEPHALRNGLCDRELLSLAPFRLEVPLARLFIADDLARGTPCVNCAVIHQRPNLTSILMTILAAKSTRGQLLLAIRPLLPSVS